MKIFTLIKTIGKAIFKGVKIYLGLAWDGLQTLLKGAEAYGEYAGYGSLNIDTGCSTEVDEDRYHSRRKYRDERDYDRGDKYPTTKYYRRSSHKHRFYDYDDYNDYDDDYHDENALIIDNYKAITSVSPQESAYDYFMNYDETMDEFKAEVERRGLDIMDRKAISAQFETVRTDKKTPWKRLATYRFGKCVAIVIQVREGLRKPWYGADAEAFRMYVED